MFIYKEVGEREREREREVDEEEDGPVAVLCCAMQRKNEIERGREL